MATIEHPTTPGFREVSWLPVTVVAQSRSPFSLKAQVYKWSGQMRVATCSLPIMTIAEGRAWQAFFMRLNGPENSFYLTDQIINSGNAPPKGAGLVNGGSQTGSTIVTDGWVPNRARLFEPGELVQIGERLHNVLTVTNSDASGNATLTVWPQVASAASDNSAIEYVSPKGIFRLTEMPALTWNLERLCAGMTFTAEEVF